MFTPLRRGKSDLGPRHKRRGGPTITSSMLDAALAFFVGSWATLFPASVGGLTVPSSTAHGVSGCARAVGGVGKRVLARPTTPATPSGSIK